MPTWKVATAPAVDPILGLSKVFALDPNPQKMDLLAGVLRQEGKIWLFKSVQRAQQALIEKQTHKGYQPIDGNSQLVAELAKLLGLAPLSSSNGYGLQTLGSTGALSLTADLLKEMGLSHVFISEPSWPNHRRLFEHAKLEVKSYNYLEQSPLFDRSMIHFQPECLNRELLEQLKVKLSDPGKPQALLLHGVCHNPTGIDFNPELFDQLLAFLIEGDHCLIIDIAYHGLKKGLEEDASLVRRAMASGVHLLISYSCSKNFSLYGERVGALFMRWSDPKLQSKAVTYLEHIARSTYSNPPINGSSLLMELFRTPELYQLWIEELAKARHLLHSRRTLLARALSANNYEGLATSCMKQSGLFFYFPLALRAVDWLRQRRSIYLPKEGRMNLTSINEEELPRLIEALKEAWQLGE